MRRLIVLSCLCAAAAAALPAAAHADAALYRVPDGGIERVYYTDGSTPTPGVDRISLFTGKVAGATVVGVDILAGSQPVRRSTAPQGANVTGCDEINDPPSPQAWCLLATAQIFNAQLNAGDDVATVPPSFPLPVELSGGPGNDAITGGSKADVLLGGEGDDTINAQDGVADQVDCGPGSDTASVDSFDAVANCEQVLIDDDRDGVRPPADCNDASASVRPGAPDVAGDGIDQDCSGADTPLDTDRDGYARAADCNDFDAAIHPGALEILSDRIDQNCDGVDPLARVGSTMAVTWLPARLSTKASTLTVQRVPANARVQLLCSGRGCPFTRRSVAVPKGGNVRLVQLLKKRSLRYKTVLEVRVTAPNMIGNVVRYTVRKRLAPRAKNLCLPPGASKPGACA
jgi:hypothetical protein